ncbi:hypothetical protein [Marinimicrobium alkaliphilum]|uniref:hypothetical protein n=1 Tax=Marinimicrobium alkaliphilum TaxID=2202654 RepID=UPI000DBAC63B|nr:hypothetical protein [Marinimicrobium alkaliphilum]
MIDTQRFSRFQCLALLAVGLLLNGCATEFAPSSQDTLESVARDALGEAAYMQTLVRACRSLGGDTADEAEIVYGDWLDAHWAHVVAADDFYSQRLASRTHTYSDRPLALDAVDLSLSAQARALDRLDLPRRSLSNQHNTCRRQLDQLSRAQTPLLEAEWQHPYLDYLLAWHQGPEHHPVREVPSLAIGVRPRQEPGRSYYAVEEQARQTCDNARLTVIDNDWPQEAYGVFCGEQPRQFVSCDWGHCEYEEVQ